jgi:predicted nucleic acid-binding protein
MSWCFEDESDAYADAVLSALRDGEALVPPLWPFEVVNVLLLAERRKRLARAAGSRFLEMVRRLPIRVEELTAAAAFDEVSAVARETGLTAYDGAYLSLAMTSGFPLATRDAELRIAAEKVGVSIFTP